MGFRIGLVQLIQDSGMFLVAGVQGMGFDFRGQLRRQTAGGGKEAVVEELTVTENGAYHAPPGVDGYNPVTVDVPVPDGYVDTRDANATERKILAGYSGYVDGKLVEGSMPDNGVIQKTFDGIAKKSVSIPEVPSSDEISSSAERSANTLTSLLERCSVTTFL